jgi:hypothetical protein
MFNHLSWADGILVQYVLISHDGCHYCRRVSGPPPVPPQSPVLEEENENNDQDLALTTILPHSMQRLVYVALPLALSRSIPRCWCFKACHSEEVDLEVGYAIGV